MRFNNHLLCTCDVYSTLNLRQVSLTSNIVTKYEWTVPLNRPYISSKLIPGGHPGSGVNSVLTKFIQVVLNSPGGVENEKHSGLLKQ